jgi:hypothetical protein
MACRVGSARSARAGDGAALAGCRGRGAGDRGVRRAGRRSRGGTLASADRRYCTELRPESGQRGAQCGGDNQDRIYVFQRKDPPVVVFDRGGKYLGAWGSGEVTDPHGLKIVGDTVYTTDRSDSVAKSFTLDGKPLMELGQRGRHSDTGNITNWLAERAAGPFNHPTEMMAHPTATSM